ncbi:MAG: GntR family transcriptional regulator [Rothia sp. (in: high G+C Gram-positive bacteria)]|nr:GntR family transcriptional regulator [Rothia sp. (in: high G+C Gram-positive bacteria)]
MSSSAFPLVQIDRSSPVPLYHQLVDGINKCIASGEIPTGSMLPNELEIASRLHLSRPTVRKAMDELVRSGLLVRKRGVGTQVVSSEIRRPLSLSSLYTDLQRSGISPSTRLITFETLEADEKIAQQLQLDKDRQVYHLVRVRYENATPLALMENWIPVSVGAISAGSLEQQGLYDVLRSFGVIFSLAHQKVGATVADAFQAAELETRPGAPLLTMERTAMNDVGVRVETGSHVYRADLYSFEMTLSN